MPMMAALVSRLISVMMNDGDLGPVLRLEELHQHVHDLGKVLDVLVLAQDGKVLYGL